jgi:hypothetical protein
MSKTLCPRDQGFNFLKSVVGLSHTSGHGCGHYENIKKKDFFSYLKVVLKNFWQLFLTHVLICAQILRTKNISLFIDIFWLNCFELIWIEFYSDNDPTRPKQYGRCCLFIPRKTKRYSNQWLRHSKGAIGKRVHQRLQRL